MTAQRFLAILHQQENAQISPAESVDIPPVYCHDCAPYRRRILDKIGDQLPAIGITAASLTLVFLGFLFTSWESYETVAKRAVYKKYLKRGWMAFAGMEFALLSVVLGFVGIGTAHTSQWVDWLGVASLAAWASLTSTQAVIALRDIK